MKKERGGEGGVVAAVVLYDALVSDHRESHVLTRFEF